MTTTPRMLTVLVRVLPGRRRLAVAATFGGLGQSVAGATGGILADRIAGPAVAGLPQSAVVLGAGISAVLVSGLVEHWGRGGALAAGAAAGVVGALAVVVGATTSALVPVLAGSVLLGAGNGATMLSRYAAADGAAPEDRARAMALVLTATTVGAVAGPLVLSPADVLGREAGLAPLSGPFVVAGLAFLAMSVGLVVRGGSGALGRCRPTPRPAGDPRLTDAVPVGLGGRGGALDGARRRALGLLAGANLVMVAVMTLAPVHLVAHGGSLGLAGLMVALHVAAMFGPSTLSGRLVDGHGAVLVGALAGAVTGLACGFAALAATAPTIPGLVAAMVALGLGWNLAMVAGSAALTADADPSRRPRLEARGEVVMAAGAVVGGLVAGPLVAAGGYPLLALGGAVVTAFTTVTTTRRGASTRGAPVHVPAPVPSKEDSA